MVQRAPRAKHVHFLQPPVPLSVSHTCTMIPSSSFATHNDLLPISSTVSTAINLTTAIVSYV
jgi:hypothetical protein